MRGVRRGCAQLCAKTSSDENPNPVAASIRRPVRRAMPLTIRISNVPQKMQPNDAVSEVCEEMSLDLIEPVEASSPIPQVRLFPRHEQTFPELSAAEIARMRRFGEVRRYRKGELIFETGKPGPGMFVILSGNVAVTQRDGLGHITPVIRQGPGQFMAELGQLSGRDALVDGRAEGEVETFLIPRTSFVRCSWPRPILANASCGR